MATATPARTACQLTRLPTEMTSCGSGRSGSASLRRLAPYAAGRGSAASGPLRAGLNVVVSRMVPSGRWMTMLAPSWARSRAESIASFWVPCVELGRSFPSRFTAQPSLCGTTCKASLDITLLLPGKPVAGCMFRHILPMPGASSVPAREGPRSGAGRDVAFEVAPILEERQEVRHLRDGDALLQPVGHQGHAGGGDLVHVLAQHHVGLALGALERQAGRRLRHEDAAQRPAVLGGHDVVDVVVVDRGVGVEDVGQQCVEGLGAAVGDVGGDVGADAGDAVAGGAVLLEDRLAAERITLPLQGGTVLRQDLRPVGR